MPRFAAIDVGSNAMRLAIVEATPAVGSRPPAPTIARREVLSTRASVRLGQEVFVTGRLAASSIGDACAALKEFREAMDTAKVDSYRATATSAVREAHNRSTLVERAQREAGIELEIIEGVEEARLIQLAVTRRLGLEGKRALLVDVGGGSTELTDLDGGHARFSMSLPIGTVRLLEMYLRGVDVVDSGRQKLLREGVDRALKEALPHLRKTAFDLIVGTGGTIETLADLVPVAGGFGGYPRAVDVAPASALVDELFSMTPDERRAAYSLRPDRADTIVTAAPIFLRVAERFKATAIVAAGAGLKDGILEELIDKHFDTWDREGAARDVLDACVRLGRRYGFDERHGALVAKLAAQLFDATAQVHGLGDRDRLLLRAAAQLHDIGDYVRYDGHHKHSYYLISHSDIMGLPPADRAIVANVARYHRKSPPDTAHANFRELDKTSRAKVRSLAAILRIADALDREHLSKVEDVSAHVDGGKLVLTISGDEDRELEEWTVRAKSDLLRDVLALDVSIASSTARTSVRAEALAAARKSSPPSGER